MISLIIIDHQSWWTEAGSLIKYFSILLTVVAGIFIFIKYPKAYILGAFVLFFIPHLAVNYSDKVVDICMEFGEVRKCSGWIHIWLSINMLELLIIWVPLTGIAFNKARPEVKMPNKASH